MKRRHLFIVAAMLCWGSTAFAQSEISNDTFDQSQMGRIGSAQLKAGEMYEARFTIPQNLLPIQMVGVRVVMVAGEQPNFNYCGRWHVEVWEDSTNPAGMAQGCFGLNAKDPGTEIYSMSRQFGNNGIAFQLSANPMNYQDLLFSTLNNPQNMITVLPVILTTPEVRVGLKAVDLQCGAGSGDDFPVMLTDADGFTPDRNYLYGTNSILCPQGNFNHFTWDSLAPLFQTTMPGDFVMRLLLKAPVNPIPDMGMDMMMEDMQNDMIVIDMRPDGSMDMTRVDMNTAMDMMNSDMPIKDMAQPDMNMQQDMSVADMTQQDMKTEEDMPPTTATLAITSVSPNMGSADNATDIAILGDGFAVGAEVTLNAKKIGVVEVKPQRILATVPPGMTPGAYDVIVTNADGKSVILSGGFTVTDGSMGPDTNNGNSNGAEEGCGCRQVHTPSTPLRPLVLSLLALGFVGWRRRRSTP